MRPPLVFLLAGGLSTGCLGTLGDEPSGGGSNVDPGRITMHRLNRVEYANTVHDLLGTTTDVSADFPTDDRGYGFDNIADVLSLSPLHLELYQRAAETLVGEALSGGSSGEASITFEAESLTSDAGGADGSTWVLSSAGDLSTSYDVLAAGDYKVTVRAWAQQAGPEVAKMSIAVTGATTRTIDVPATSSSPGTYEATFTLTAGSKTVSVGFINDFYDPTAGQDRNLIIDWFSVTGPIGAASQPNPLRANLVICDPAGMGDEPCLRAILVKFTKRAFRRPPTDAEVDRLVQIGMTAIGEGQGFDAGLSLALEAVLVSPHFLYRVEIDPNPTSLVPHQLNPYELASRLSYFVWSSMPDDALFAAADAGELGSDDQVRAQVTRMLDDPKASQLVENFAGQWLYTRALDDHVPDYTTFPEWDDELEESMREETTRLFREVLDGGLPIDTLLTADFTWVNARLAEHYGLPPVTDWTRVSLADVPRRGVLGQGTLLTVTSFPTRTSPVKRGKWVLEQLLCSGPPPPPPGVEGLPEDDMPAGSLREQLEAHRSDPTCAACHAVMDPIGFGLESFDAIGRFRTEDTGGFPIDDSGMLADGTTFAGAVQLADIVSRDPRFARCVVQKMYTYALGRGPEEEGQTHIDALTEAWTASGLKMRDLIVELALHPSFRMRRGER